MTTQSGPEGAISAGPANPTDSFTRALAILTLAGVATIAVICILVQFLRTDLDWIEVTMSLYVVGPWGALVQASFFAPAPGIAALGIAWYRTLDRRARHLAPLAPLVLFAVAAVALCITAANVADQTNQPVTLHGAIHQWAAFATFLCATIAMLLQALRLRFDPRWRNHFPAATALASLTFAYFWIFALVKAIPRGLGEKIVIGLVLLWMWCAAWWLLRDHTDKRLA